MDNFIRRRLYSKVTFTIRSASDNTIPSMPQFALNADSGIQIVDVKRDFIVDRYEYHNGSWEDFTFPFNDKDTTDSLFVYDGVVPEFDKNADASYLFLDLFVEMYQELPLPMSITQAKKYAKDNSIQALWELCLDSDTPTLVPHTVEVSEPYSMFFGMRDDKPYPYVGDVSPISQADYDLLAFVRTATSNFNYHFVGGMKVDR